MTTYCNACGNIKPIDTFAACSDCRAMWRHYGKKRLKPDGNVRQLERATELILQQSREIRALKRQLKEVKL
tara:strand:+ start:698 stop:910 length:213 start_codon:yes stop_codon:yes gene_type:complete